MKKVIVPYGTVVECRYCNHEWKPRSKHPEQCPHCFKTWQGDFAPSELQKLKLVLANISRN